MSPIAKNNNAIYILPLSALAVSAAAIITGVAIRPKTVHPLKTNEAAKILDQYNDDLKQKLGLPRDYPSTPTTP